MNRRELRVKRVKHLKLLKAIEQKKSKSNNPCKNLFDLLYSKQTEDLKSSNKMVHSMYVFM